MVLNWFILLGGDATKSMKHGRIYGLDIVEETVHNLLDFLFYSIIGDRKCNTGEVGLCPFLYF